MDTLIDPQANPRSATAALNAAQGGRLHTIYGVIRATADDEGYCWPTRGIRLYFAADDARLTEITALVALATAHSLGPVDGAEHLILDNQAERATAQAHDLIQVVSCLIVRSLTLILL